MEFCNCSKKFSKNYQNALICSNHFNEDDYENKYITKVKIYSLYVVNVQYLIYYSLYN